MSKAKIQNFYKEKIKLLDNYNKFYYEKSLPKVSDQTYDELKKEILLLEKQYDYLKSDKSISRSVGYKPSKNFKKVLHRVPMLSLGNAFTENDLVNFEKKKNIFSL